MVRVHAAYALGKLNDTRGTESLIQLINNENQTVRGEAAQSLGYLGGVLGSISEDDPICAVIVDQLIQLLNDDDPRIREKAVIALFNFNDTNATEPLVQLLDDDDPVIRMIAARSLGRLGRILEDDPIRVVIVDQLIQLLDDEDIDVRVQAETAL